MVSTIGLMEEDTKAIGVKGNNMEKENTSCKMGLSKKVFGKREKELNGSKNLIEFSFIFNFFIIMINDELS